MRSAASRRRPHRTSEHLRLDRLRALAAQLERLPASRERDWVIAEVRARAVDVETGEVPRALRALEPEAPLPAPTPAKSRRAREAPCPALAPQPTPIAEPDAVLGRGEVLWADEPWTGSDDAGTARAWTRGLRG
jgi:hypothetical protein